VIYSRARAGNGDISKAQTHEEEEPINLSSGRTKYQNFWVGVNRGIFMDSRNPLIVDEDNLRTAKIEKVQDINVWLKSFFDVAYVFCHRAEIRTCSTLTRDTSSCGMGSYRYWWSTQWS
jgi:hypothetical protein